MAKGIYNNDMDDIEEKNKLTSLMSDILLNIFIFKVFYYVNG